MAQTYLKKIELASKAEYRNGRKIRLMILIITIAAALFEASDFTVSNNYEYGAVTKYSPNFDGFFGIFLMFVAAAFGAFVVFGVFSDLTNKQTADVQLSLPMSAKDRYLSKLLAVAKLHILPLLGAGIFVTIAGAIKGDVIMGQCISYLLQLHCVILAEALFVDAICIFCMSCCGAKAEGVYTSIITGLCASMTPFLVFNFTIERFSGVYLGDDESGKNFASFGALVGMCIPDTGIFDATAERITVLFINILLSCLLIFVTFFIYRKRDGRHVGKPMVYDLFMELFMFTGLFTLFTMFSYADTWGIGLTVALIIYLVIRIVAARAKITPVTFLTWLLKYGVSLAAFVIIMAVGFFTGGFGHYKLRIKNTLNDTVRLSANYYSDDSVSFYQSYHIEEKYRENMGSNNNAVIDGEPSDMISQAEMDEKITKLNALIDKYYDITDRDFEEFKGVMLNGNNYYDDRPRGMTNVNINISDDSDFASRRKIIHRNDFSVLFNIPEEKQDEFIRELGEIIPQTEVDSNRRLYEDEY